MSFPFITVPQFFDSSGAPLANGTIEFRNPNDDTYINSYPTAAAADAQGTANANPLTLNARGEAAGGLYLEDGVEYKVTLRSEWPDALTPGDIIWTQTVRCPVDLPYARIHADETTAGVTPTDYSYPVGHVFRYGATGDGTTEDHLSIQKAIDVATVSGGIVFMPAGTYLINGSLQIKTGVTLRGEGWKTIIKLKGRLIDIKRT